MIDIGIYCNNESCRKFLLANSKKIVAESKILVDFTIFKNSEEIIKKISKNEFSFDGIILDIDSEEDILEIGERIKKHNLNISIIFLSKDMKNILKCLDIGAFNYIIKNQKDGKRFREQFKKLIIQKNLIRGKFMIIKRKGKQTKLKISDIEYIEVINRVAYFKYRGEKIEVNEKISILEKELKNLRFIRCHREFLVNLYFVKDISKTDVTLLSGEIIPVSRLRLKEIKDIFTVFTNNKKLIFDKI